MAASAAEVEGTQLPVSTSLLDWSGRRRAPPALAGLVRFFFVCLSMGPIASHAVLMGANNCTPCGWDSFPWLWNLSHCRRAAWSWCGGWVAGRWCQTAPRDGARLLSGDRRSRDRHTEQLRGRSKRQTKTRRRTRDHQPTVWVLRNLRFADGRLWSAIKMAPLENTVNQKRSFAGLESKLQTKAPGVKKI